MPKFDTICIIDDDAIHTFTIKRALALAGFSGNTISYKDGKEAFEQLSLLRAETSKLPNLILLDLNMPVWNGWDFLDAFSEVLTKENITTYILSSSVYPEDLEKSQAYRSVNDYFTKPLGIEKLKELLS